MTAPNPGEDPRQPARTLADLVVARRPAGVPYADGDDHDARALLDANGYATTPAALVDLLASDLGIVQAAAARVLGASALGATALGAGERQAATDALDRLARDAAALETARVQAAFALARLDVAGGRDLLVELLAVPPETSPAPLQAAGALARLDDPRGFAVVRAALDSANPLTAMVACKQLHAFVALDGRALPGGGRVDAYGAFGRALARAEPNVAAEARAQLAALDTPQARAALAAHPAP